MSTYADFSITTIEDFKQWILTMLGDGLIVVELTDRELDTCINNAIEIFTKYATQEEEFYAFNLSGYVQDVGITLPRNVTSVHTFQSDMLGRGGVDTLFSLPNQMWNAGVFPIPGSYGVGGLGTGGGWVSYHLALGYMDLIKRMMGGGYQFEFNPRTKIMKMYPDPTREGDVGWVVCGTYVIRPETYIYGEDWVKRYALAESKIILGTVRGKFTGVQILGGGQINPEIKNEGISERNELLEKLKSQEQGPYRFFVG